MRITEILMETPPVLLILFNRYALSEQLLARVKSGKPGKLYIAVDGARDTKPGEREIVEKIRGLCSHVEWDCVVKTRFSASNLGCRDAVTSAINWFFENEESGIILEDDCHPEPSFFLYCGILLSLYRHDESIMMISGLDVTDSRDDYPEESYYVHKYQLIWGWATWRRAWRGLDLKMNHWRSLSLAEKWRFLGKHCRRLDERFFWLVNFDNVVDAGERSIWSYQWLYTMWLKGGRCISPVGNLISNKGFGNDATHKGSKGVVHEISTLPIKLPFRHAALTVNERLERQICERMYMYGRRGVSFLLPSSLRKLGRSLRRLATGPRG